jgi:phosphoribosylformylglycinamidine (FGAM) synthase-like enzyme
VGNLAVLLGSTTGRDGIGGVSVLASAGFDEGSRGQAPAVQVGDPFEEKRLIEACLALLDAGLVVGIQDLGGAGLTCATSETAANGRMGMDFDVSAVPRARTGMEPFEVMTSESRSGCSPSSTPEGLDEVLRLCERWEVRPRWSARSPSRSDGVGPAHRRRLRRRGARRCAGQVAPRCRAALRPAACRTGRPGRAALAQREPPGAHRCGAATCSTCSYDTTWVSSQYDHQLFLNTVEGPGGDAVVLRLKHPTTGEDTGRGLALTTDGNHRWCAVDPRVGTALTVAESVLNLA